MLYMASINQEEEKVEPKPEVKDAADVF